MPKARRRIAEQAKERVYRKENSDIINSDRLLPSLQDRSKIRKPYLCNLKDRKSFIILFSWRKGRGWTWMESGANFMRTEDSGIK